MVRTLVDTYPSRAELVAELPPADVALQVRPTFVADGPEAESYTLDRPSQQHGMWWAEIS